MEPDGTSQVELCVLALLAIQGSVGSAVHHRRTKAGVALRLQIHSDPGDVSGIREPHIMEFKANQLASQWLTIVVVHLTLHYLVSSLWVPALPSSMFRTLTWEVSTCGSLDNES